MNWDDYFMNMVYLAAMKSKDPATHIGAVVTTLDNQIISTGYNGFPRGIGYDTLERLERPTKYFYFSHGEENAILHAIRIGIQLKGCKMYTTSIPCCTCGRMIIQAGITEVITDKEADKILKEGWGEQQKRTLEMFKEVGIKHRQWNGELFQIERYLRRT